MLDSPILITGCARSGTSLTAAMIYYGGAFGGSMKPPNKDKRNATLENHNIRQNLVKAYLRELHVDPMGQFPLPNLQNIMIWDKLLEDGKNIWRKKVIDVIVKEGYKEGHWFYKGAKMCLLWPLWHNAFPNARWIITHRNKDEIINSCLRTSFMRAYKNKDGWEKWFDHHIACFRDMAEADLDILHVVPSEMINGNFNEIEIIINSLGLKWDEQKAKALINPNFWRRA